MQHIQDIEYKGHELVIYEYVGGFTVDIRPEGTDDDIGAYGSFDTEIQAITVGKAFVDGLHFDSLQEAKLLAIKLRDLTGSWVSIDTDFMAYSSGENRTKYTVTEHEQTGKDYDNIFDVEAHLQTRLDAQHKTPKDKLIALLADHENVEEIIRLIGEL